MEEIVEILMRRDGLTRVEAWNLVEECNEAMEEMIIQGNYEECENTLKYYLSLEPDYLIYFL